MHQVGAKGVLTIVPVERWQGPRLLVWMHFGIGAWRTHDATRRAVAVSRTQLSCVFEARASKYTVAGLVSYLSAAAHDAAGRWRNTWLGRGMIPLGPEPDCECCQLMQHVLLSLLYMMRNNTECVIYSSWWFDQTSAYYIIPTPRDLAFHCHYCSSLLIFVPFYIFSGFLIVGCCYYINMKISIVMQLKIVVLIISVIQYLGSFVILLVGLLQLYSVLLLLT